MNTCFDRVPQSVVRPAMTILLALSALSVQASVRVEAAWVREVPPVSPAAAVFMTLENTGADSVRLSAMSSPLATEVQWHDMLSEQGVMRMRQRKDISLLPGKVSLQPGGSHLMLLGLKQPLAVGMKVPLLLTFAGQLPVRIEAEVRPSVPSAGSAVVPARAGHVHAH